MLNYNDILEAMQLVMNDMVSDDLLDGAVVVDGETQIIGPNSPLDSIVLVVFLTGLEEKLESLKGGKVMLVLNKIHDFNVADTVHQFDPYHPTLHADTLARFIQTL